MTVLRGAGPTGDPGDGRTDEPGGSDGADGPDGYDTAWLDLREAADARTRSVDLLAELAGLLGPGPRHLLDVGAGTGAMQRWCTAHLPGPVRWTLLDPDARLLDVAAARARAAAPGRPDGDPGQADDRLQLRVGRVRDLDPDLLRRDGVDALVCSALLDVLPAEDVVHLVDVAATAGVPLLAALTVTGRVHLDPPHPHDALAAAAVHRTATADGASGPSALTVLAGAAGRSGLTLERRRTPWRLDPASDRALLAAWAAGYVAAARAGADGHGPAGRADLADWAGARLAQVRDGGLSVAVDHDDVLLRRR